MRRSVSANLRLRDMNGLHIGGGHPRARPVLDATSMKSDETTQRVEIASRLALGTGLKGHALNPRVTAQTTPCRRFACTVAANPRRTVPTTESTFRDLPAQFVHRPYAPAADQYRFEPQHLPGEPRHASPKARVV